MRSCLFWCCTALVAIVSSCNPRGTTPTVRPLVLGETFHLESTVLAERRVINVYLPPGYAESANRYPVLYMPDGGLKEDFPHIMGIIDVSVKNETMRPFILVGIENTERRRDLVGPTAIAEDRKIAPRAGGADRFRQFLRNELKAAVAARYRVTAESAIVGESFAGLFVLETLLTDPDLFDSYIAVDPSVWWNDQSLARGAASTFASWKAKPKALYLTTADTKDMQEGAERIVAALRQSNPPGLVWHYEPMPHEHHHTIFHGAALKAFRTIFAPAPKPDASSTR